ncbi:MAG: T9SS type B sorting domain-containing protein, partial [Sphingobacteriaceae bacterium]|nr:T9SS type B sorting domain-containing protein [Sphingobacteriaceae bacterium]
ICVVTSGSESKSITVVIEDGQVKLLPNNNITREHPNWYIKNIENYTDNVVTIYDRYGRKMERIVNYNNENNTWNGEINGKKLEESTYYYVIDLGEGKEKIKGFITIVGQ